MTPYNMNAYVTTETSPPRVLKSQGTYADRTLTKEQLVLLSSEFEYSKVAKPHQVA